LNAPLRQYRDENGRWPDPIGEYQPFPRDEQKFDAAVRDFARREATGDWFPKEVADSPEAFVEFARNSGIGKMLRTFHDLHGRYPTYEEAHPPDGLRLKLSDMH